MRATALEGSLSTDPEPSVGISHPVTALVALGGTGSFYFVLMNVFADTTFGRLFGDRGWCPYAITFLSIWASVMAGAKYLRIRRLEGALAEDLLPANLGESISSGNALQFQRHLRNESPPWGDVLYSRLSRSLELLRLRREPGPVVEDLARAASSSLARAELSYTLLRVCIWAIPILGFIGTVGGISEAIGGFDQELVAADDLDQIRTSLGVVTAGLAKAFETTLLALVMSVFVMFPVGLVQRIEGDYLHGVDDYCARRLIPRLVGSRAAVTRLSCEEESPR